MGFLSDPFGRAGTKLRITIDSMPSPKTGDLLRQVRHTSRAAAPVELEDFEPDCERCCGLCCVAPVFAASSDFAISKKAGEPCPHLASSFRCTIHHRLRAEGFPGCVAYDCFGAGQKVTQVTFGGRDWRQSPEIASPMFDAFRVMRELHRLMRYLAEALTLPAARPLFPELRTKLDQLQAYSLEDAGTLAGLDVPRYAGEIDEVLLRVGVLVRTAD
jgi:hypothetical protein